MLEEKQTSIDKTFQFRRDFQPESILRQIVWSIDFS